MMSMMRREGKDPLPVMLRLILATTIARAVHALSNPHPHCERITAPMCQGLGYNNTRMPNFMGHDSQKQAMQGLQEFDDLLTHKCSPFLRLFVCSVYTPLCSEDVPVAVPACRGLCEEVRRDCMPVLQENGLTWPAQLNCSSFPEPPDLCMQQPPEDEIAHYTTGNELVPAHHLQDLRHDGEIIIHHCPPNTVLVGYKCMKLCGSTVTYNEEEKILLEVWIAIWSIMSLAVAIFALITFLIQPKRFRWPARPILYLTSCGFFSGGIYFIRWMVGSINCSGEAPFTKPFESWLCISVALSMIYCDFAFSLWWCTFSYVWYLSAAKEWSTEAIEKISARIHSIVWSVSVIPIVYALVANNINLNSYTGFCEVISHVLVSAELIIVSVGVILAVFTSRALKNVRKALLCAGRSPFKLERLIYRLGVINLGISLPICISLLCYFFEGIHVELLKISTKFLSVMFSSFWVFSYKTFKSWNKMLRPNFTYKLPRNGPVTKV